MASPNMPGKKSTRPARESHGEEVKLFLDPGALPDSNSLAFISKMLELGKRVSIRPIDPKSFKPVTKSKGTTKVPSGRAPNFGTPSVPTQDGQDFKMPPELNILEQPLKQEPEFDALQGFSPDPTEFAPAPTRVLNSVQRFMTPPKPLARPRPLRPIPKRVDRPRPLSAAPRPCRRELAELPTSPANPQDVPPHKKGMKSAVKKRRKPRIIKPQPLCWGPAPPEPKKTGDVSAVEHPYEFAMRLFKSG